MKPYIDVYFFASPFIPALPVMPLFLCGKAKSCPLCLTYSAVSGDDYQEEAHRAPGAMPMLPWGGGGHLRAGLLTLQPAAGAQGDLQLRAYSGGALPRR